MATALFQQLSLLRLLLLSLSLCTLSATVFAQAGSRPALLFDSANSFYHSLSGSLNLGSGSSGVHAIVPEGTMLLPRSMRFLLWVELGPGQLNVLERVGPDSLVLRKRIPVSIGKEGIGKRLEGDKKTPVGIYRLTSFLRDAQLDDFYGEGAYPLNYPNPRDAILGRTGHGIWLHGLPKNTEQRPLLDSDGCIVIDNESLGELQDNIVAGHTWIVMSPSSIKWIPAATHKSERRGLQSALNTWKQAWEAKDDESYLDYYADDFTDLYRNKAAWSDYKRRVNGNKRLIKVEFSDMSMMADPLHKELVTVRYYQKYQSDNYDWAGWKEQVWRNSDQGWKIVYEGSG